MSETSANTPVPLRAALAFCALGGRRLMAAHLGLVVVQGALPLLGLYAMQWLIDAVVAGSRGDRPADEVFGEVLVATGVAAAVALAGNVARGVGSVVAEAHGRRLADGTAQRLQEHAQRLDLGEFDRPGFHDLLHRAGTESSQRPVRLVQDLAGFGTAVVSLLLMGTVLGLTQPWLPVVVAAAAAPISFAQRRHARIRFGWHRDNVHPLREVGYTGSVLCGRATAKDVRMHGLGGWFARRLAAVRAGLRGSLNRLAVLRARDELLVYTLATAALFGAYVYLGQLTIAGTLTVGALVLHAQAVQRTQNALRDLLGAQAAITESRLFLRPLQVLTAMQPAIAATPPPAAPPASACAVTATGLTFAYPESARNALAAVTFRVAAGQRVGIVGRNGSGKSTLLKLICRLYDPSDGALAIGDVDLRRLDPEAWRGAVSVLFQDANTFELSLRDNLRLGRELDDETLWRALATTGLAEAVRALPNGLDTPVSRRLPGGIDWSGGNLRRLALARSLAAPTPLLLLDEPFAQLDAVAVRQVEAELAARAGRQTVFVADHHAAAVRGADHVLLLDDGRLTAAGAPAVLARDARFAMLFPSSGSGTPE